MYYLAGADGKNGVTPNIGDNGNWWVNGEDTGIPATGKDGQNGKPGESGHTPEITIGSNGNWYIDGVDTGMPSRGEDGEPGEEGGTPVITIGDNGNWFINGVDTGKPSRGEQGNDGGEGQAGATGQSAYELWVQEVNKGTVYKDGVLWPKEHTTVNDFWEFLRGKDGEDGKDGDDGLNGVAIIKGKPNAIIQFYTLDTQEFVNWGDGSVKYRLYDSNGKAAPQGSKVKLPGIDNEEFTADEKGYVTVPKEKLPAKYYGPTAQAQIDIAGDSDGYVASAENTIVPARMLVQMILNPDKLPQVAVDKVYGNPCINVWFMVQRKVRDGSGNGTWENIPAELGDTRKIISIYQKNGDNAETLLNDTDNEIDVAVTGGNNNCMVQIRRGFVYTPMNGLDKNKVDQAANDKNNGYYNWGEYQKGTKYYSRLGVKGCYGEDLKLDGWIEMLPAQFAPTVKTMVRSEIYTSSSGSYQLIDVKGTFDVANINWDLCLNTKKPYVKSSSQVEGISVYEPVKVSAADLENTTPFVMKFTESTGSSSNISSMGGTMTDPTFTADNVRINSQVFADVQTSGQHAGILSGNFYEVPLGTISSSGGKVVLRWNGNYVTAGNETDIEVSEDLSKDENE